MLLSDYWLLEKCVEECRGQNLLTVIDSFLQHWRNRRKMTRRG